MPGYNSQRRGTDSTLPKLIVLFYVSFACKCVLYWVSTQMQLTNISNIKLRYFLKNVLEMEVLCVLHAAGIS